MVPVDRMLGIALCHDTSMAAAMVDACLAWGRDNGVVLRAPSDSRRAPRVGLRPSRDPDWRRMVECNADTREMHQ